MTIDALTLVLALVEIQVVRRSRLSETHPVAFTHRRGALTHRLQPQELTPAVPHTYWASRAEKVPSQRKSYSSNKKTFKKSVLHIFPSSSKYGMTTFLPACRRADIWYDLASTTHLCVCISHQRGKHRLVFLSSFLSNCTQITGGSQATCVFLGYIDRLVSKFGTHSVCHIEEGTGGSCFLVKGKASDTPLTENIIRRPDFISVLDKGYSNGSGFSK